MPSYVHSSSYLTAHQLSERDSASPERSTRRNLFNRRRLAANGAHKRTSVAPRFTSSS